MIKYLPWWSYLIIFSVISAAIYFAIHEYNDHFRDQGRAEIQEKWDAQKKIDADAHAKDLENTRFIERTNAANQAAIAAQLLKDKQNETDRLNVLLAQYSNDNRRLRLITGKAERESPVSMSDTQSSTGGSDAACTVRLPDDIGTGFKELRESIIRNASTANAIRDQLAAAQAIIISDRQTCGVN